MSTERPANTKRLTVPAFQALKGQRKIVSLTAYTAPMAALLDPLVEMLLVGDSMEMVLYGQPSTLSIDLDTMIRHGRAVTAASAKAMIIVDMPFGSYQASPEQAFAACARVLKETGCTAVKLEGGLEMVETVRFLTARAIPVMSHIGLMPQHVHSMGGYRWQGRDEAQKARLMDEALQLEAAGACSLLLEGVDAALATVISSRVSIPTIGIGAGAGCDGQILVTEDMLGLSGHTPKFVKRYGNLRAAIEQAVSEYADEVRTSAFPGKDHSYGQ